MKKLSPFAKLVAMAACALTLGSCNRAEYAMLPKGSSYHGVTRVATPVPAASAATPAAPAPAPEAVAAAAPAATPATVAAPSAPAKPAGESLAPAATKSLGASSTVVAPAPKLNPFQRLALNKVSRKVNKLMQQFGTARQHDNTASTTRGSTISGNLRTGIILLLVGLLVGILNNTIGAIIAIIGLVFIVLWLLDQA